MKAYFEGQGAIPPGLWEQWDGEDADGDGVISWDEFSGPKGLEDDEDVKAEL